jgi:hypothetical protein
VLELFSNQVQTTVSSGGTTAPSAGTSQTWTVASSAGFPAASSTGTPPTYFRVTDPAASSEKMIVTNVSGTTWTVTRGAEGTTPVTHSSGFTVQNVLTSGALELMVQEPLVSIVQPSGDTSGATDAAAISAAVSALPSTGGVVRLVPTATWYIECGQVVVSTSGVYIDAAGCYINAVGAGDVIRMYDTDYGDRTFYGGGLLGFPMIDGSATTGNSCGFHGGDILQLQVYAQVRHFNAGTTSKGVWIDNNYQWTEQGEARVFAQACTTGVAFDNSVNTSGTSTGSFDRFSLTAFIDQQQQGDGVVLQNGAILVDGALNIYGNFGYHSTTTYAVLRITGSNVANSYSLINGSAINIGTECYSGSGSVAPQTIAFGSGSGTVTGNSIWG